MHCVGIARRVHRVNLGKLLRPRYLIGMERGGSKESSLLAASRESLLRSGQIACAELVAAVWEVCYGGCGFNMTEGERQKSYEVSKLLFCDPSSVRMMIAKASQNIPDQILRDELRKLSKSSLGKH